jgi:hypothetical protein
MFREPIITPDEKGKLIFRYPGMGLRDVILEEDLDKDYQPSSSKLIIDGEGLKQFYFFKKSIGAVKGILWLDETTLTVAVYYKSSNWPIMALSFFFSSHVLFETWKIPVDGSPPTLINTSQPFYTPKECHLQKIQPIDCDEPSIKAMYSDKICQIWTWDAKKSNIFHLSNSDSQSTLCTIL